MSSRNYFKIGGEFELNPSLIYLPETLYSNVIFDSGRSALLNILNNISLLNPSRIHIPYYICESVYTACLNAGYEICFYELNEDFTFNEDYLSKVRDFDSILLVNYFGFIKNENIILNIKKYNSSIIVIEDNVQSFWSYKISKADYSFTSLRKTLNVPDGGVIHISDDIDHDYGDLKRSSYSKYKLLGGILKFLEFEDELYLNLYKEGELELNMQKDPFLSSYITAVIMESIELNEMKVRRIDNYHYVYNNLDSDLFNFVFDFDESVIPSHIPIMVPNRDKVRSNLINNNCFLPVHWPLYSANSNSEFASMMSNNSLSIVIDHRYETEQIDSLIQRLYESRSIK